MCWKGTSVLIGICKIQCNSLNKREVPSLHDTVTSHLLHGNSIPNIGSHCFWHGLIALPKKHSYLLLYIEWKEQAGKWNMSKGSQGRAEMYSEQPRNLVPRPFGCDMGPILHDRTACQHHGS